jgi:hypothetical protein
MSLSLMLFSIGNIHFGGRGCGSLRFGKTDGVQTDGV